MQDRRLLAQILGRTEPLFEQDVAASKHRLADAIGGRRILVLGAAGSIGSAFVRALCPYAPAALHLVDLSENNLAELVRDLRAGDLPVPAELQTLAIDIGSIELAAYLRTCARFDLVANFAALKHVRSERDPFTLMRMLAVNVLANDDLARRLADAGTGRLFAVSSDKAVRPASLMGASKAFMERVLLARADLTPCSSARFANVAFSDGSLLHSFVQRLAKGQPLAAPTDVRRYFLSHAEAGQLCLLGALAVDSGEIAIPRLRADEHLMSFADIARTVLRCRGLEPVECADDADARAMAARRQPGDRTWPCVFSTSDTSGEKPVEEFTADGETVDDARFDRVGVIARPAFHGTAPVDEALARIRGLRAEGRWTKAALVDAVRLAVPELAHVERHRNLDQKM